MLPLNVNADGTYGRWAYRMAKKTTEVPGLLKQIAAEAAPTSIA